MARTKKNPITDPNGEKQAEKTRIAKERTEAAQARVKEKLQSVGTKASEIAANIGTTLQPVTDTISSVANAVTTTAANAANTANNISQALSPTGTGYKGQLQSSQLQANTDIYGGLSMPAVSFDGLMPSDLLAPSGLPKISEEQLTTGLAEYAGATRAQKLYQAGFKYIEEVGKTKQQFHKAEQSLIKASTESVKTQQEIVRFDKQNVELETDREKLEHSNERLKQSQITTTALRNETAQMSLKFEALEGKREAEINSIRAQTQDVIQKYLKDSINNGQ